MKRPTDSLKARSQSNGAKASTATRPTAAGGSSAEPNTKSQFNGIPRARWRLFNPFDRALPPQFELTPIALTGTPALTMRPRLGQLDRSAAEDLLSSGVPSIAGNPFGFGTQSIQSSFTLDWVDPKARAALAVMPITRLSATPQHVDATALAISSTNWLDPMHQPDWSSMPWLSISAPLDLDSGSAINVALLIPASTQKSGWWSKTISMLSRGESALADNNKGMKAPYLIRLFKPGIATSASARVMQDVRNIWYSQSFTTPAQPATGRIRFAQPAALSLRNVPEATLPGRGAKTSFSDVDDEAGLVATGTYDLRESSSETLANADRASTAELFTPFYLRDPHASSSDDDLIAPLLSSQVALSDASMKDAVRVDLNIPRGQSSSHWTGGFATQVLWIINENYRLFATAKIGGMKPSGPTRFGILAAGLTMALLCRRRRSISPISSY